MNKSKRDKLKLMGHLPFFGGYREHWLEVDVALSRATFHASGGFGFMGPGPSVKPFSSMTFRDLTYRCIGKRNLNTRHFHHPKFVDHSQSSTANLQNLQPKS